MRRNAMLGDVGRRKQCADQIAEGKRFAAGSAARSPRQASAAISDGPGMRRCSCQAPVSFALKMMKQECVLRSPDAEAMQAEGDASSQCAFSTASLAVHIRGRPSCRSSADSAARAAVSPGLKNRRAISRARGRARAYSISTPGVISLPIAIKASDPLCDQLNPTCRIVLLPRVRVVHVHLPANRSDSRATEVGREHRIQWRSAQTRPIVHMPDMYLVIAQAVCYVGQCLCGNRRHACMVPPASLGHKPRRSHERAVA